MIKLYNIILMVVPKLSVNDEINRSVTCIVSFVEWLGKCTYVCMLSVFLILLVMCYVCLCEIHTAKKNYGNDDWLYFLVIKNLNHICPCLVNDSKYSHLFETEWRKNIDWPLILMKRQKISVIKLNITHAHTLGLVHEADY